MMMFVIEVTTALVFFFFFSETQWAIQTVCQPVKESASISYISFASPVLQPLNENNFLASNHYSSLVRASFNKFVNSCTWISNHIRFQNAKIRNRTSIKWGECAVNKYLKFCRNEIETMTTIGTALLLYWTTAAVSVPLPFNIIIAITYFWHLYIYIQHYIKFIRMRLMFYGCCALFF